MINVSHTCEAPEAVPEEKPEEDVDALLTSVEELLAEDGEKHPAPEAESEESKEEPKEASEQAQTEEATSEKAEEETPEEATEEAPEAASEEKPEEAPEQKKEEADDVDALLASLDGISEEKSDEQKTSETAETSEPQEQSETSEQPETTEQTEAPKEEGNEEDDINALLSELSEFSDGTEGNASESAESGESAEGEASNDKAAEEAEGLPVDDDIAQLLAGIDTGDNSEKKPVEDSKPKEKLTAEEKKGNIFSRLWHKLFDNVKVDPSKIKPEPTKEELEEKKKQKEEAKAKAKEEKEAKAAEKKDEAKREKEEKQRKAREIKQEKKAKKLEQAKLMLEEMDNTRINRAGAAIVFIFFAMIAVVIIVGTNIFSYSISVREAEKDFSRDEYTQAYEDVFGLEPKDEDIVLFDQIMTVMYVQKQLNSYYSYNEMKDYPKALDSLLKGLQRYEKYIELAIELDIESDLDLVRNRILDEMEKTFNLKEREAMAIIQSKNQLEYSQKVFDAVENME